MTLTPPRTVSDVRPGTVTGPDANQAPPLAPYDASADVALVEDDILAIFESTPNFIRNYFYAW